jgi:beta-galactosidase
VRHPDAQSFTGFGWYRTDVTLTPPQTQGKTHLMFPGLFNECWLYVNGVLIAHRPFPEMWWNSDYRFEWDVDLSGILKPGANTFALRFNNPHHFGGIFRRPFLYRAK